MLGGGDRSVLGNLLLEQSRRIAGCGGGSCGVARVHVARSARCEAVGPLRRLFGFRPQGLLRFRFAARRSGRRFRIGTADPAVELLDDDLAHVFGNEADDQIDDPLLVAAAPVVRRCAWRSCIIRPICSVTRWTMVSMIRFSSRLPPPRSWSRPPQS